MKHIRINFDENYSPITADVEKISVNEKSIEVFYYDGTYQNFNRQYIVSFEIKDDKEMWPK